MATLSAISSWVNSARYNCQRPPSPFGQPPCQCIVFGHGRTPDLVASVARMASRAGANGGFSASVGSAPGASCPQHPRVFSLLNTEN